MAGSTPSTFESRPSTLFTVGHSNRPLADFLAILKAHGIDRILDVRRYPVSRKWPHFDAEPLSKALGDAGIAHHEARMEKCRIL